MILIKKRSAFAGLLLILFLMGCQNSETDLHAQSSDAADSAKVVMVEYSDFQCPACAYYYPIVEKLKQTYGDKLTVKYKYFPLNSHQYSMLAARAAEAARNQGKFQAMHNRLFANQDRWASASNPATIFIGYAKEIGLNIEQFKDDLNAAETQKTVMEQKKEGIDDGVNSTPTFYLNGEKVMTLPRTYEEFKALIDIYLAEAKKKTEEAS